MINAIDPQLAMAQAMQGQSELASMQPKAADLEKSGMDRPGIEKQIEEKAKEFESMFLSQMLKPMFEGVKPNSLFGGGKTEEIFREFMIDEYGKMITERGGIGIADAVKAELLKLQGGNVQTGTQEESIEDSSATQDAAAPDLAAFSKISAYENNNLNQEGKQNVEPATP